MPNDPKNVRTRLIDEVRFQERLNALRDDRGELNDQQLNIAVSKRDLAMLDFAASRLNTAKRSTTARYILRRSLEEFFEDVWPDFWIIPHDTEGGTNWVVEHKDAGA